jgi:hypothetical protein
MANTFVKLATVTVGTATLTIEFSSIPATYNDLALYVSARSDRSSGTQSDFQIRFNGDTASNYAFQSMQGNGSTTSGSDSTSSTFGSLGVMPQDTDTASVFGASFIYIPIYTSAVHKSYMARTVRENNATSSDVRIVSGIYKQNTAISSITLFAESNTQNFKQHSTATLYGIKSS